MSTVLPIDEVWTNTGNGYWLSQTRRMSGLDDIWYEHTSKVLAIAGVSSALNLYIEVSDSMFEGALR